MLTCLALALAQASPIEVVSPDGKRVARIERERLVVFAVEAPDKRRELWDASFRSNIGPARYALSNSGRVLAQVAEHFNGSHTMVRIQERDREPVKLTGDELLVPREVLSGPLHEREWLDAARAPSIAWMDTWFGPRLVLDVPCRGGLSRTIDVEHVTWIDSGELPPPVRIEPAVQGILPERCAVPYVHSVEAASVARSGVGFEIAISAAHATPGWTLLGFELEARGDDGRELILTPRSQAPDAFAAQVLSQFRTTAKLIGLRPGRYTLDVEGWSTQHFPLAIDVVPEDLLIRLRTSGGFAGIDRWIEVFSQSVARFEFGNPPEVRFIELSDERMNVLRGMAAALPAKNRRAETKQAADLFHYALGFWRGENWISIEVDDLSATADEKALIEGLSSILE